MAIKKGVTSSGFEFEIDDAVIDDMELIDAIADAMDNNPFAFSRVCAKLLGSEQRKKLYDHLRENGRVPLEKIGAEITDIFTAFGDNGKNL